MMTLDHVGDREAMVYAQLGQQPLARTTETSPELNPGTPSCLSARPPDLADAAITRPRVVSMSLRIVPFVYSKRAAAARSLVSLIEKRMPRSLQSSPHDGLFLAVLLCLLRGGGGGGRLRRGDLAVPGVLS